MIVFYLASYYYTYTKENKLILRELQYWTALLVFVSWQASFHPFGMKLDFILFLLMKTLVPCHFPETIILRNLFCKCQIDHLNVIKSLIRTWWKKPTWPNGLQRRWRLLRRCRHSRESSSVAECRKPELISN